MPHVIAEYTRNLEGAVRPDAFLATLCDAVLAAGGGVFPPESLRARALCFDHYRTTGDARDGYVHIIFKVGPALDAVVLARSRAALFAAAERSLAAIMDKGRFGLSLEVVVMDDGGTTKRDSFPGAASG